MLNPWRRWVGVLVAGAAAISPTLTLAAPADESPQSHAAALQVVTEDAVLKEQIVKVHEALAVLDQQIAERRRQLQQAAGDAQKSSLLYAEVDGLRKEYGMLERLLNDLVEEAKATEWTAIDQALARAKRFERHQEGAYQRQEVIRDRQQ